MKRRWQVMKTQMAIRNDILLKKYREALDRLYLNKLNLKKTDNKTTQNFIRCQIEKDQQFVDEFERENFN